MRSHLSRTRDDDLLSMFTHNAASFRPFQFEMLHSIVDCGLYDYGRFLEIKKESYTLG